MLKRIFKTQFSRDLKRAAKQGKNLRKIAAVINLLCEQKPLPAALRDHALKGKYAGLRDCHIEPDLVLIYRIINEELQLLCIRLGSHADLFGK